MNTHTAPAPTGFRAVAREWLAQNFPKSLAGRKAEWVVEQPLYPEGEDWAAWLNAMADTGWSAPTWPKKYGGGGLTTEEEQILTEEMEAIGAFYPVSGVGHYMFAPTLLEVASEEQKLRHIPPIARGEIRWCQGYSEPGAGSDLASLRTKAEDMGDHFLVNGQKIWTSGSIHAHWCFCLVRTDTTRKHEGISFLLIDMSTPGIEVRRIHQISGNATFGEVFFTDVKVPKENLVGALTEGWTIAKRLMQHERSGIGARKQTHGDLRPVDVVAKEYIGTDDAGRIADYDLRSRITRHKMWERAHRLTVERVAEESKAGPSTATSVLKNAGSIMLQTRGELLLEIMGMQGLGWEGDGYTDNELETLRVTIQNKAHSIFGGTYEIQNNIIAKRILGMQDHQ